MADLALYALAKRQTVDLVLKLDEATLARTCVACPKWSIRDVVAHHVHFLGAFISKEVPSSTFQALLEPENAIREVAARQRDEWTETGVTARREISFANVLVEWDQLVANMPPTAAGVAMDLTMHLADIQETLGGDRQIHQSLIADALRSYYEWFLIPRFVAADVPTLGLICTDTHQEIRSATTSSMVAGSSYELLRSIGGRRSRLQVDLALDWQDTPEATRELFSVYGWA